MDKSFIGAPAAVPCAANEERIGRHSSFTVCCESSMPHISSRIPFGLPLDAVTNLPFPAARPHSRVAKRFNFSLYARTFLTFRNEPAGGCLFFVDKSSSRVHVSDYTLIGSGYELAAMKVLSPRETGFREMLLEQSNSFRESFVNYYWRLSLHGALRNRRLLLS